MLFEQISGRKVNPTTIRRVVTDKVRIKASENLLRAGNEVRVRSKIEINFMEQLRGILADMGTKMPITYQVAHEVCVELREKQEFVESEEIRKKKFGPRWFKAFKRNFV